MNTQTDLQYLDAVQRDGERSIAFQGLQGRDAQAFRAGIAAGAGVLLVLLREAGIFRPVVIGTGESKFTRYQA